MLIHNADITGSLLVNGTRFNTGSFSGSFKGTIEGVSATASYVEYTNVANKPTLVSGSSQITYSDLTGIPSGIVSGSSQVTYSGLTGIPSGIVSGSAQVDFAGISNKPTLVSGSSQITYSDLTGIPSGIVSGSTQIAGLGYATTSSNTFIGNQTITGSIFGSGSLTIDGNITSTGQIVAQTINVQQVTSSIVYSCGSNVFGTSIGNTQQFTGSMFITGSNLNANVGSACFQGSVSGATIYGSTAVCSPVGKFTSCIDAGSGTFSSSITAGGNVLVPAGSGLAWSGGASRIMTPEDNVQGAKIATPGGFLAEASVFKFIGGNVGIGVTSPQATLHLCTINTTASVRVESACDQAGLRLIAGVPGTARASRIDFLNGATCVGRPQWTILNDYNQNGTNDLSFVNCDPATRVLQIFQSGIACFACQVCAPVAIFSGCVGINTTSPSAKLDVSYSGEIGVRLVGGGGACAGNMFRSYIGDYSDESPINLFWANHGNPARTNTLVRIHTNETAAGGYPLRITAQGSLCSPTCEALVVNHVGNVIIGNTVASNVGLTIYGTNAATIYQTPTSGTGTGNGLYVGQISDVSYIWNYNCFPLVLATGNADRMRIDSCGNIAVGGFSTSGTPGVDYRSIEIGRQGNTLTGSPFKSAMYVSTNSTITAGSTTFTYRNTGVAGYFGLEGDVFFVGNAISGTTGCTVNFSERMRITSTGIACFACQVCAPAAIFSGCVGIGTTLPKTILDVVSGTNTTLSSTADVIAKFKGSLELNSLSTASSGTIDRIYFNKSHTAGINVATYTLGEIRSYTSGGFSGGLDFFTGRSLGAGAYGTCFTMRLDDAGNVGIMTTDPKATLHVCGSTATLRVGPWFSTNDRDFIQLEASGTDTRILSPNERFKIENSDGCIQIVAGTSGGVQLTPGATSWASMSDIHKKKNFEPTQGLAALLQIEPIKYHFEWDNNCAPKRLGFIAQNLQPLIPEMVKEIEETIESCGTYLTITPDYLLPVLVKSIQEQQCTICSQAYIINTLKICLGIA